jgi:FtsH-binding integral membrane protein
MNEIEANAFDTSKFLGDRSSHRIIFLRKTYSILTIQLIVGLIFVSWAMNSNSYQNFLQKNYGLFIFTAIVEVLLLFWVFFARSSFRKAPTDVVTFLIFTLAQAYNLAYITAVSGDQIILMITALSALLTFSLLIYALTTKFDLTYLGGTIYVLGSALFGFEIFLIASDLAFTRMIYVALAIIVFGFYLIYDTQFLMIGSSLNSEVENAFVGAIVVYVDVILIFFRLVQLLGRLFKKSRH